MEKKKLLSDHFLDAIRKLNFFMSYLKKCNPTSSGSRGRIGLVNICSKPILKKLLYSKKNSCGRNNIGRITTRHRGGGKKRKIRKISFSKQKVCYIIKSIEYDPNRSSLISLVTSFSGEKKYVLHIKGIKLGDIVYVRHSNHYNLGDSLILKGIPLGIKISQVELIPGKGAKLSRSAGSFCVLVFKSYNYCVLRLKSGQMMRVNIKCIAVIGQVGNSNHYLIKKGKAGVNRRLGIRPTVRGVAMNPVDHPHGGGEGKTSTGRHPVTPAGFLTKGLKTRKIKRTDKFLI